MEEGIGGGGGSGPGKDEEVVVEEGVAQQERIGDEFVCV